MVQPVLRGLLAQMEQTETMVLQEQRVRQEVMEQTEPMVRPEQQVPQEPMA
jgi:hypothetical protein